jgi:CDP-2,3-bis-(O-geranylgeranyl)-sn-glycerol synthase
MQIGIEALHALALLVAANATPVIVAKLIGDRPAAPLDFGCVLWDGDRLFGSHKTWRGLAAGILAGTAMALLIDLPWSIGAGFAAASLVADALSSAVKRRLKLRPGTEVIGLDQLGEALLPLVLFARSLSLDTMEVAVVTVAFTILDIGSARLRHRAWFR